jgi:hypothetical protein
MDRIYFINPNTKHLDLTNETDHLIRYPTMESINSN